MTSRIGEFAAVAAVLVAIPGPAVILVLKSAMLRGRVAAVVTALGVLTADLIWATASVLGLTALLVSSQIAFDLVRIAGAAYLIYLGVRLVLRPSLGTDHRPPTPILAAGGPRRTAFVEGVLNDMSNPKTVMVYASVIPQFLGPSGSSMDLLLLGVLFAAIGFVSLVAYSLVFGATRGVLGESRLMRASLRVSGGVLAVFGIGLIADGPAG